MMKGAERGHPDKTPDRGEIKVSGLLCLVSIGLVLSVAGCTPPPLLSYSTDVPGQTLNVLEAPDVRDGRARFREIFCAVLERHPNAEPRPCADFLHELSDEPVAELGQRSMLAHDPQIALLFVPGLFSDCVKRFGMPFETSAEKLRKRGYSTSIVAVSGRSSPAYNAPIIAAAVRKAIAQGRQQVVLIGHSKGVVDSLEFLVAYPQLAPHVLAVVSVVGAINGSPLGDALSGLYEQWLLGIDTNLCPAGDDGAVSSLRRSVRLAWLRDHPLPKNVSYYSLASFTRPENMHWPLRPFYHALEEIDPNNDGQLLYTDQVIPGSTLLGEVSTLDDRLVLIGYSKGVADILELLVAYPDLAARVTAVVSIAGAVNGTPLADAYADAYAMVSGIDLRRCAPGDGGVVDSVRRDSRMNWLARNRLPEHVSYYSVAAMVRQEDIARLMFLTKRRLGRMDPRQDGQMLVYDQLIPGSTLLGYAYGDHWAVVLPLQEQWSFWGGNANGSRFPRATLFEAIVLYLIEAVDLGS